MWRKKVRLEKSTPSFSEERLGMVLAVKPEDVDKTMEAIRKAGDTPYVVGRIEAGEKGVDLC